MTSVHVKPINFLLRHLKPFKISTRNNINVWTNMGQYTSSLRKKDEKPEEADDSQTISKIKSDQLMARYAQLLREKGVIPDIFLVKESPSSRFVDEDGDVANEFLTEEVVGSRRKLCRKVHNIRPEGNERHAIPRLSPDLPLVMWEMKS